MQFTKMWVSTRDLSNSRLTYFVTINVDLKFVELTADVLASFFIKYVYTCIYICVLFFFSTEETHPHSILQVPTTQLTKMSIDPKFVELTADVLEIFLLHYITKSWNEYVVDRGGDAFFHFYQRGQRNRLLSTL